MITPTVPQVAKDGRYTAAETCKHLGISRMSLHRYTTQGLIRFRLGRVTCRKLYAGSDILAFWRKMRG